MIIKEITVEKMQLIVSNPDLSGFNCFYEIDLVPAGLLGFAPKVTAYVNFGQIVTYKADSSNESEINYFKNEQKFKKIYSVDE